MTVQSCLSISLKTIQKQQLIVQKKNYYKNIFLFKRRSENDFIYSYSLFDIYAANCTIKKKKKKKLRTTLAMEMWECWI